MKNDLSSVVSQQGGLSSGESPIRVVFQQGRLSSGWSFSRVVSQRCDLSSSAPLYFESQSYKCHFPRAQWTRLFRSPQSRHMQHTLCKCPISDKQLHKHTLFSSTIQRVSVTRQEHSLSKTKVKHDRAWSPNG